MHLSSVKGINPRMGRRYGRAMHRAIRKHRILVWLRTAVRDDVGAATPWNGGITAEEITRIAAFIQDRYGHVRLAARNVPTPWAGRPFNVREFEAALERIAKGES